MFVLKSESGTCGQGDDDAYVLSVGLDIRDACSTLSSKDSC